MRVHNLHVRRLNATEDQVGTLIDSLAGPEDRLWPRRHWPAMRFDRPLAVGAVGGHGPVRYTVEGYHPGRWVRFRFTAPLGFDGWHEYSVRALDEGAELHHLLSIQARTPAWLTWPLLWGPLHDAVLEDSLDKAERALHGSVARPAQWSPYVRLLRRALGVRASKPTPAHHPK